MTQLLLYNSVNKLAQIIERSDITHLLYISTWSQVFFYKYLKEIWTELR